MLKMGRQGANRLRALRFDGILARLATAGRGDIVGFINDEEVKRPWVLDFTLFGQQFAQQAWNDPV